MSFKVSTCLFAGAGDPVEPSLGNCASVINASLSMVGTAGRDMANGFPAALLLPRLSSTQIESGASAPRDDPHRNAIAAQQNLLRRRFSGD